MAHELKRPPVLERFEKVQSVLSRSFLTFEVKN